MAAKVKRPKSRWIVCSSSMSKSDDVFVTARDSATREFDSPGRTFRQAWIRLERQLILSRRQKKPPLLFIIALNDKATAGDIEAGIRPDSRYCGNLVLRRYDMSRSPYVLIAPEIDRFTADDLGRLV